MKALLKAGNAGPGIVGSTLIVSLIIGPALPDWAGIALFYCGLAVVGFLAAGVGESHAVGVLFSARALNENERTGMAPVIAALCHLELGPPVVELFVSRRHGSPAAIARGRRSVVLAPEFVHGVLTGQLPHREAVAVLAHASLVARARYLRFLAIVNRPGSDGGSIQQGENPIMPAQKKYDEETQARAVRMYADRTTEVDVSQLAFRKEIGALLGIKEATLRNWIRRDLGRVPRPGPARMPMRNWSDSARRMHVCVVRMRF